jgi:hypothetical protein
MQLPVRPKTDYDTATSADRGNMAGRAKKKNRKKKVVERKKNRRIKNGSNWHGGQ